MNVSLTSDISMPFHILSLNNPEQTFKVTEAIGPV